MRCGGLSAQRLEAFQRQRQVRAALGRGQGVDLVDDHPLDAAQRLARLRGEQQVERLGRGDQDVRRPLAEGAPLVRRRVAGAHRRRAPRARCRRRAARRQRDARQRRAQVAVHVVDERLERRDVQHAQAAQRVGRDRLGHQAVEAPQERGERLARPGGRADQRVRARGDGRPALAPARRWARRTTTRTSRASPAKRPPAEIGSGARAPSISRCAKANNWSKSGGPGACNWSDCRPTHVMSLRYPPEGGAGRFVALPEREEVPGGRRGAAGSGLCCDNAHGGRV